MLPVGIMLMFAVSAGPAGTFSQVRFEGNRSIPARVLRTVVVVRPKALASESQVEGDAARLSDFYHGQGFLDAGATWREDTARGRRSLVFVIREGRRARIRAIRITGADNFAHADLAGLLGIRERGLMIQSEVGTARSGLLDFLHEHGYYFAACSSSIERTTPPDSTAALRAPLLVDVNFSITEGPLTFFRRLQVRGNKTGSLELVERLADIRTGQRFSQTALARAQRRLYATRLFERIYLAAVPSDTADTTLALVLSRKLDSVDVRIDLSELPPRSFGFGVGLQFPPLRGLLSAEWEHLSVWGKAHDFRIATQYSPTISHRVFRDYQLNLDILYRIPYVTRWSVNLETRPFIYWTYNDSMRQLEFGAITGVNRDFTPNLSAGLANRLDRILIYDTTGQQVAPVRAITNSVSGSLLWDTRNDILAPTHGFYVAPFAEVAGGILDGSNSFYRFTLEGRLFYRLIAGHVLALRAMGGYVVPYGRSDFVPFYEEFYLGGTNSLRGYDERSVGPVIGLDNYHYGDILVNTNVELRSPFLLLHNSVVRGIGLVLFSDGGLVTSRTVRTPWDQYQFTAGVGIRFNTLIGPVRLDYGKRLTNPPPGDKGKIYFAILNLF